MVCYEFTAENESSIYYAFQMRKTDLNIQTVGMFDLMWTGALWTFYVCVIELQDNFKRYSFIGLYSPKLLQSFKFACNLKGSSSICVTCSFNPPLGHNMIL